MPPPAGDSDGEDGHDNGAESPASPDSAFGAVFQSDHSDLESSSDPRSDVDANGDRSQSSPRANDGRPPSSSESNESNDDASKPSSDEHDSEPSSEADDDGSQPSSEADDDRGRRRPAGFFDLEAEDDQDSDMEADGDDTDQDDDDQDLIKFPQFSRFAPELRRMVWEAYCPDLTSTQGRVYDIMAPSQRLALNVTLPQRTLAARTVLAVSHESRTWALQAFPDEFTLPSAPGDVLRFDKRKDIVIFNHVAEPLFRNTVLQQVHNLAVGAGLYDTLEDLPLPGSPEMPNLAQIFFTVDARDCHVQDTLSWCASKPAIFSSPVTFVEEIEGRESAHLYQYCWPDVREWRGFDERESELADLWGIGNIPFPRLYQDQGIPLATGNAADDDSDDDSQTSDGEQAARTRSMVRDLLEQVPIYPLVLFQDEKIVRNIQSWNGDPVTWVPEFYDEDGYFWRNDDSVGSLTEEYDSSGIDDSEIEERSHGDEDEDDLDLDLDDVDESDHLGFDGAESEEVSGDESPLPLAPARFSSPESTTVRGDSTSTDGEQGEVPGPSGHSGSRTAISIEDDSDDDSGEVAPRKRKRATRSLDVSSSSSDEEGPMQRPRKRRIISDDSDSDDSAPRKRARRATIVTDSGDSDSDDAQMMETSEVAPKKKSTGRRTNPIELSDSESASGSDGSSPSESEEEEDDDDAPPTKPMSLAERLALNRQENPIPISDSEDGEDNGSSMPEEEEGDEEDHDGGAVGEYAYGGRFPDDDEGNDDSSAQEEAQEGGIFDEESDEGY